MPTTILCIDDDPSVRAITARTLSTNGYRSILAGTVRGALELLQRDQVALILLDLQLPEVNGWEAIKLLKSDPALRDIPIVVVSVTAIPDARKRALDLGASAFVGSPITETRVLQAIQAVLGPLAAHA